MYQPPIVCGDPDCTCRDGFDPDDRSIAHHRAETDPCEANTPGCCIDHGKESDRGYNGGCETW